MTYSNRSLNRLGRREGMSTGCAFASILLVMTAVAGWVTHIIWLLTTLLSQEMTLNEGVIAIIGVIVAPVGVIHGFGLWVGWFPW